MRYFACHENVYGEPEAITDALTRAGAEEEVRMLNAETDGGYFVCEERAGGELIRV